MGQSDAVKRNENFAEITDLLKVALANAGSSLPEIECD
jgi:hypothetical protein